MFYKGTVIFILKYQNVYHFCALTLPGSIKETQVTFKILVNNVSLLIF